MNGRGICEPPFLLRIVDRGRERSQLAPDRAGSFAPFTAISAARLPRYVADRAVPPKGDKRDDRIADALRVRSLGCVFSAVQGERIGYRKAPRITRPGGLLARSRS